MAVAVLCASVATGGVAAVQWKWLRPKNNATLVATAAPKDGSQGGTKKDGGNDTKSDPQNGAANRPGTDAANASAAASSARPEATGDGRSGDGRSGDDLTRAERAAALSAAARKRAPVESLLLAVEAERALGKADSGEVGGLVEQALRDAVDHCSGFALSGHGEPVRLFAISADGRRVVTVADRVRGWDLAVGQAPRPGPQGLREFTLPAASEAAAAARATAVLPATTAVRFAANGGVVELVTAAGEIWQWDWTAPELLPRRVALPGVLGPLRAALFCEWPPAGSAAAPPSAAETAWLATCDANGAVAVWRISGPGAVKAAAGNAPPSVEAAAVGPPSVEAAAVDPAAVDPAAVDPAAANPTAGVERRAQLSRGGVRSLAVSGDGRYLATAGGVVQVWDLAAANVPLRATLLAPEHFEFNRVAASTSGDWIAAVDVVNNLFAWRWRDRSADTHDLSAPPVPSTAGASVTGTSVTGTSVTGASAAGTRAAVPAQAPPVVGAAVPAQAPPVVVADPQPERAEGIGGPVSALLLDPAAQWVAVASVDRSVRVFNLEGEAPSRVALPHAAPVRDIVVSPGGEWLISRAVDGLATVWWMDDALLFDPRFHPRPAATFRGIASPVSLAGDFRDPGAPGSIYNAVEAIRAIGADDAGGSSGARGLAFSDAGGWLASVDGDGQFRGWFVGAGLKIGTGPVVLPLATLAIPGGPWRPLAWAVSPRGDRVAALVAGSAEAARSIEIWRIDSGRGFVPEQALAVDMAPAVAAALAVPGAVELLFSATGDALALLAATAEGPNVIGHTSLWRITAPTAATRLPHPSDFQLAEPLGDVRFGANWLLGLTPTGRLRVWTRSADALPDRELPAPFVEQSVAAHRPARELRLSPRGQRLALLHELPMAPAASTPPANGKPSPDRGVTSVISVWGPPVEPGGDWTQTGSWPFQTASPDFVLGDRWLVVSERSAANTPQLLGYGVTGGPATEWKLDFPAAPEFRLNRDGDRLLAIAAGTAWCFTLGESPQERAVISLTGGSPSRSANRSPPVSANNAVVGPARGAATAALKAVPGAGDATPAASKPVPGAEDATPAATDATPAATDTAPAVADAVPVAAPIDGRPRLWAWSPNGRLLAVGDRGLLSWWDFDTGPAPRRQSAEMLLEGCQRLLFDSHGDFLIALDDRGVARVCPTRRGDWTGAAQWAAGRNFTAAEWNAAWARAGEPYRETFAGWGRGVVAAVTAPRTTASSLPRGARELPEAIQGRRVVRYHIESLPALGTANSAAAIVREAWQAWEKEGPLRAEAVAAADRPHVVIRAERLDGPAGAPAHGQLGPPREGVALELRLDSEQAWTDDLLRLVTAHELGHLLGLGHTATPGQLMSDSVPDQVRTPQAEDIRRLLEIWLPAAAR